MIRIAICDDNMEHSTELENIIFDCMDKHPNIKIETDIFDSGLALLNNINLGIETYQLLFLDIEMNTINGIETAQKIREDDKNLIIIYVTSYDKYTLESFKVAPFRYLLKPINKKSIEKVLLEAIQEIQLNNQYLFFKYKNNQYQLRSENITSISTKKGRMLKIIAADGEKFQFYGQLKDMENQLNPLNFVKVNQGTILNLNYIHIISGVELQLTNGDVFFISRGQKKIVNKAYNNFIKRRIGL